MTRTIVIAVLLGAGLLAASPGCSEQGVGDPCTPEQEYNADFNGFNVKEVNIESKSFQCRTRVCLVNHFQGRVSCPYGQNTDGSPASGEGYTVPGSTKPVGCIIPGSDVPITGNQNDPNTLAAVSPQCLDRTADRAVYCSCRCADINGNKPSDENFCKCPDGFTCTPLVTSIGVGNEGLTGSYCVKSGTDYVASTACNTGFCDESSAIAQCQ
ncbi:MAG: hypothetical protein FWD69_16555 [Polyangiaceae bacterium]|nr:hypothetical protein [Polyangiaceae bacterium]